MDGVGVHVGPVHLEASLAVALGKVHGEVGVPKQIVGRLLRALAEGDADAGPHRDVVVVDAERRNEGFGDALGDHLGCLGHRARLDQHGELVATETGDRVTGPGGGSEPFGHGDQQAVAGRVSEAVVDRLEVVEVQEQHGDRVGPPVASVHGVGEPVKEQGAVGQAGERVVEGLVVELLLEGAAFGHVAAVEHDRADVGLIEQIGDDGIDREPLAVGVGHPAFEADAWRRDLRRAPW